MSRQLRIEYPGATYHVMSRGIDRGEVFRDDRDRMRFLELLAAAVRFGHLDVHSYALMSTHFHLLCETPHGDLSQIVGTILGTYTRNFNLRHGRTGRLRLYVYSLFKFTLLSGKDIAGLVGLSPSAAGKIRKRFDRQRNSSPELKRTMEAIEAQLKIERENAKLPVADLPGPGK